jgi:MoaA/NifB/PqqE/SkfB family radical SAM enzyme
MIGKTDTDYLLKQYGKLNSRLGQFHIMPAGYFLYLTDLCNLVCDYCWQRLDGSSPNSVSELCLEEWIKVVENIPRFRFIGLTGGEATTVKGFDELVVKIKERGHPLSLNTNGILLNEERLYTLVSSGLDNISISIDGFAENFDRARGSDGLFDRIVENIKKLNQVKKELNSTKPTLTIKTVLLEECIDEMEDFYEYCSRELLAKNLNISFMKTSPHAQFDTRILQDWEQVVSRGQPIMYSYENREKIVQTMLTLLTKSKTNTCKVSLYPGMTNEAEIRNLLDHDGINVYDPCHIPWAMTVISPIGEVMPCISLAMGNVRNYDYDIKKCYQTEKYESFLTWLRSVNKSGKTASVCNMCCFLKVNKDKGCN